MAEVSPSKAAPDEPGAALTGHGARVAGERLRELADDEAARAEAEVPSEGEPARGEPADGTSESALVLNALGVEPLTDAALKAMGPAAHEFAACPFCAGYGAVNPDDLLERLPGVVEALAPFKQSSVFVRCDECDGWGTVLTGGRTAENGIQPCPKCMSHGYIDTREGAPPQRETLSAGYVDEGRERWGQGDPFKTPPPEGEPPAAGMEWDPTVNRWAYPTRAA